MNIQTITEQQFVEYAMTATAKNQTSINEDLRSLNVLCLDDAILLQSTAGEYLLITHE